MDYIIKTSSYDNYTVGSGKYFYVGKVTKIMSPYSGYEPVMAEFKVKQYFRGYQKKKYETVIKYNQFCFENNKSDISNTFITVDNFVNFDVKFLYDENFIYFYIKPTYEVYGEYLIIESKIYGASRYELFDTSRLVYLPEGLNELKICVEAETRKNIWETSPASSNWQLFTKIADLTVSKTANNGLYPRQVMATLKCQSATSNAFRYAKINLYLSYQTGQIRANIVDGYYGINPDAFYVVYNENVDANLITMSVYTRIAGSGTKTQIILDSFIEDITIPGISINAVCNSDWIASDQITGTVVEIQKGL